jgi:hypothetical protein
MRPLLKFLHTVGAIGMAGSLASLVAFYFAMPDVAAIGEYAGVRRIMGLIATWVLFPSLGLTLVAGLLAIAASPAFHNAGWAWIKAATGILIFESGFVGVLGPIQREAERSASALAGKADVGALGTGLGSERNVLLVLLAVSLANVVLGVWRPALSRRRMQRAPR